MYTQLLKLAVVPAIMATACASYGAEWMTDLDAACAKAKAEGKAVLVDFTGSDWCGWCVRLRSTILDTPTFQNYAKDKFVLMEVDIPKNVARIGAELHARNRQIAARYNVTSYPSVLVLNYKGEVLGGFIGGRDTIENVIKPLDEALTNNKKTTEARKLKGEARAQALFAVYNQLHPSMRPYFRTLRDEIAAADPKNTTGIHAEIRDTNQMEQLKQKMNTAGGDYEAGMKILQQEIEQASATNYPLIAQMRQDFIRRRQEHLVMHAKSIEDVMELKKVLLDLAEYSDFEDAADMRKETEEMFRNPEEVLEMLKAKQADK